MATSPYALRGRGRPRLAPAEAVATVSVKMPISLYDRLYAAASQQRVSISTMVRRSVDRNIVIPK